MDSDDEDFYDTDEENDAEADAERGIKEGKLKVLNLDGTFRCPFSPGRKKQDYKYSEILQHAQGVTKGGRGHTAAGKHRALLRYLTKEMAEKAKPQAERYIHMDQRVPNRVDTDNKLVCPWMGILQNIDNHKRREGDHFRIGPGSAEIKEKFKAFHPESVKVFYDVRGHLGMAVIAFRNTMDGFKDAEAFENSFLMKRRGRLDFERDSREHQGGHLYGWMASIKDVPVEGPRSLLVDHLMTNGDLKSLSQMVREMDQKAQQQVTNLKGVVDKKENTLQEKYQEGVVLANMVKHVEEKRLQAEKEKAELVETHKMELEELEKTAKMAAERHWMNMRQHRQSLETKLRSLERLCTDLQHSEMEMKSQNEAERLRHEAEWKEAQRQLELYKGLAKQQEQQQNQQLELINKHKEESKKLENELQEQRKKLEAKQRRELESQRVIEELETEKAKQAAEMLEEEKGHETEKEKEEYKKRICELEEKLEELKEEADDDKDLVNVLTVEHRKAKDEVEDAKKAVVKALGKYGDPEKLGVKHMGELNSQGWHDTIGKLFKTPQAYSNFVDSWDTRIREHDCNPIKVVKVGSEEKYVIDYENDELSKLLKKYGTVVAKAVGEACLEIQECNPSGRYIVSVPWNFALKKKATMTEIVEYLRELIMAKDEEIKQKDKQLKDLLKRASASTPAVKKRKMQPA